MTRHQTTCDVCGHTAPTDRHPCRFENACACWYEVPCDPPGASLRKTNETRNAAALAAQESAS